MNGEHSSDSENDPDYAPIELDEKIDSEDSDITNSDGCSDKEEGHNTDNTKSKKRKKRRRNLKSNKNVPNSDSNSTDNIDKKPKTDFQFIWNNFKTDCEDLSKRKSIMGTIEEEEERQEMQQSAITNGDFIEIDNTNPRSPSTSSCSSLSSINTNQSNVTNGISDDSQSSKHVSFDNKLPNSFQHHKVIGLAGVIKQLEKKHKFNVLDKSKMDWDKFKSKEGIAEELGAFNRGKNGYLDRQEFLSRADQRRFEIEKKFRNTARSRQL